MLLPLNVYVISISTKIPTYAFAAIISQTFKTFVEHRLT